MPGPRAICALTSAALCIAVYPDVIFAGRTFLPVGRAPGAYAERPDQRTPLPRVEWDPGAVSWEVLPWAHVERRGLLSGELPLWDRSNGLGHPLLGSGQTALFYPPHWIALLDPSQPALWDAIFLLLRFFAAFGSCLLLLELGAPLRFALLGAPIGALNGVFVLLSIRADLQAYACMPWVLLALVRLRSSPGPGPALALAASSALCLFAAHPEPSFVALSTCALAALALLVREEEGRLAYLGWTAIGGACALLVSAPFWLPLLDLIPKSWSLHPEGVAGWRREAERSLEWLMPTALQKGNLRSLFGDSTPFGYLGPVCSVLAACAVLGAVRRDSRRHLAWVWPALFLGLAIFGAPGTGWLARLPLISRMPIGFYYQFPVLYLLSISGAFALSRMSAREILAAALAPIAIALSGPLWAPVQSPLLKLGYAAAVCAAFGTIAAATRSRPRLAAILPLLAAADLAAFRSPLSRRADPLAPGPFVAWLQERAREGPPFRVMGLGNALAPDSAAAWGLEDVRLCEALYPPRVVSAMNAFVQKKPDWEWATSALPEDGFDAASPMLDWMNVRFLVTQGVPPFRIRSQPMAAFLDAQPRLSDSRMDPQGTPGIVLWARRPAAARVQVPARRPVLAGRVAHLREGEIPSWQVAAGGTVAGAGGEGVLRADLSAFAGREVALELRSRELAFFVDLHWESPAGDREPPEDVLRGLRIAYRDPFVPELLVLERPRPWPRAIAAGSPEVSANALGRLAGLRGASEPFAVVEDDFPRAAWESACAQGACAAPLRAGISSPIYAQNRVALTAEVNRPAVLVLADAWAEGWEANLDGRPAPLFHANHAFRGVIVPAGRHEVQMRYAPRAWRAAWALGLAGLLACAGLALRWRRARALAPAPAVI